MLKKFGLIGEHAETSCKSLWSILLLPERCLGIPLVLRIGKLEHTALLGVEVTSEGTSEQRKISEIHCSPDVIIFSLNGEIRPQTSML